MDLPQPKFKIGDTVYRGEGSYTKNRIPCPDCLGEKKWTVSTPAGETFEVDCNSCSEGYYSSGVVHTWAYLPHVTTLTIGSVRIDTNSENPISYMCEETGVGSGTIHYEQYLFASYDEASAFAQLDAVRQEIAANEREKETIKINKAKRVYKPKKK